MRAAMSLESRGARTPFSGRLKKARGRDMKGVPCSLNQVRVTVTVTSR